MQGVCHRDLKLENILLHGHPPLLKICDFGYSKVQMYPCCMAMEHALHCFDALCSFLLLCMCG